MDGIDAADVTKDKTKGPWSESKDIGDKHNDDNEEPSATEDSTTEDNNSGEGTSSSVALGTTVTTLQVWFLATLLLFGDIDSTHRLGLRDDSP